MPRTVPPVTRDDWRRWSGDRGRSEWVDGEIVLFEPLTARHQELLLWLAIVVGLYVERRRCGKMLIAPFEMSLPHSSREPDLVYVSRANAERLGPERLDGPADLAIEVVSDDSVTRDRVEKRREYEAAGVSEYWIVESRKGCQPCTALAIGGDGRYAPIEPDAEGRIQSRVIPGLWLDPDWFRREPVPEPLRCLRMIAPDIFRSLLDA